MSLESRLTTMAQAIGDDVQTLLARTSLLSNSGRFRCDSSNTWVTDSSVGGPGVSNFYEQAGTGATPTIDWDHLGFFIPKDKVIKKLHFTGVSNSAEVTELELYVILRKPNPITRWESGMDDNAEDTVTVLYDDSFITPTVGTALTGALTDVMKRTIDLDDTVDADSYLSIYVKPVGTITANRLFNCSYTFEIQ